MPDVPRDLHAQTDREYGPCNDHAAQLRAVKTYRPDERPNVLVEVDGDWCQGELRQWSQDPEGGWWADVRWRRGQGRGTHLDTFPPSGSSRIARSKQTYSSSCSTSSCRLPAPAMKDGCSAAMLALEDLKKREARSTGDGRARRVAVHRHQLHGGPAVVGCPVRQGLKAPRRNPPTTSCRQECAHRLRRRLVQ